MHCQLLWKRPHSFLIIKPGFIFGRLGGNVGEWNFRKIEFCQNYWVLSWNFLEFSKEISWVFEKSWVSVEFAFTDIERLRCKGSRLNIMLKNCVNDIIIASLTILKKDPSRQKFPKYWVFRYFPWVLQKKLLEFWKNVEFYRPWVLKK